MSIKHVRASRARWAKVPMETRSKIMAERAFDRWKNVSAEDRRKWWRKMTRAKKAKITSN